MNWQSYSALAVLCSACGVMLINTAVTRGTHPLTVYTLLMIVSAVTGLTVSVMLKVNLLAVKSTVIAPIVIAGVVYAVSFLLYLFAFSKLNGANPGYVVAIMSTSTVLVAVASILLFNAEFEPRKLMIGIPLVIAGIWTIVK